MRHLREVGEHRLSRDVLAKDQRETSGMTLINRRIEQLAQKYRLGLTIRELNADHISPGNDGDANRNGAHRAGDVVGKTDDPGRLDPGRRLEFVECDDRPRADLHELTADAKIIQHRLEQPGVFLEGLLVDRLSLGHWRLYQQFERGQYRLLFGFEVERRLTLLFGTLSRH